METNLTRNHEVSGLIPGLAQWVNDMVWLWRRPAATASIRPLAWEPAYATGTALKRQKKNKKTKNNKKSAVCEHSTLQCEVYVIHVTLKHKHFFT